MRLTDTTPFDDGVPQDRERSIGVLRRAIELGVNHIDTAAFYFSATRSANELINRALASYPEDLVIATKLWPGRDPSGAWWWAEPAQMRGQVEENLRQLGRDHLNVVNLRVPPSSRTGSIGGHFGALAELREAGRIRHLGITFVLFLAIAGPGLEAGLTSADSEAVCAAARAHGVSIAQVRRAWTLQQGPRALAIPGTGDPAHLAQNVAAGALRLPEEEMTRLTSPRLVGA